MVSFSGMLLQQSVIGVMGSNVITSHLHICILASSHLNRHPYEYPSKICAQYMKYLKRTFAAFSSTKTWWSLFQKQIQPYACNHHSHMSRRGLPQKTFHTIQHESMTRSIQIYYFHIQTRNTSSSTRSRLSSISGVSFHGQYRNEILYPQL